MAALALVASVAHVIRVAIVDPFGPFWDLLGPFGSFGVLLGPFGPFWALLDPFGAFWALLGPLGLFWARLGPFGPKAIFNLFGPGPVWAQGLFGPRSRLDPEGCFFQVPIWVRASHGT